MLQSKDQSKSLKFRTLWHYDLSDNLSTYELRVLLTVIFNTFDLNFNFLNLENDY